MEAREFIITESMFGREEFKRFFTALISDSSNALKIENLKHWEKNHSDPRKSIQSKLNELQELERQLKQELNAAGEDYKLELSVRLVPANTFESVVA